jgi:hypothetical protein
MNDQIDFIEPWTAVGQYADNLVKELRKEVTERHPLWDVKVRAIAQRTDSDDVLFEIEGGGQRLAVVHLTWTGEPETDGKWPDTQMFTSLEEWKESMMRDHKEFTGSNEQQ